MTGLPSLAFCTGQRAASEGTVAQVCRSSHRCFNYVHHVVVRFDHARGFMREYAENLGADRLFVPCKPKGLRRLDPVTVHLQIASLGGFRLDAQVELVITPEDAFMRGIEAGLGLSITRAPASFARTLRAHLRLLGRRHDALVFVHEGKCARRLTKTGYQVEPAPPPSELLAALVLRVSSVLAFVVPQREREAYLEFAACIGAEDLIIVDDGDLGKLVRCLDARIKAKSRAGNETTEERSRSVVWG